MIELTRMEEERWCEERRAEVAEYLRGEGVSHGRVAAWPAWHLAPHVSVWAIASPAQSIGWWVVCGGCVPLPVEIDGAASG